MGRKITGKKPTPATLRQRRWRKRVALGQITAEARRAALLAAVTIPDGMDLRTGDCRVVLADIPDNSVHLILTDPPYGDAAEPLYQWLAPFAARVLVPGGSLICYTGQSRLNRDFAIFDAQPELRYWWQLSMHHTVVQRFFGRGVIVNFKPVLWYVKGHRRRTLSAGPMVPDLLRPPKREKEAHDWGQGSGGIEPLIEHLTDPGELIVDPFAGTATWGRIALARKRRWIGCDVVENGATMIEATPVPVILPARGSPVPEVRTWPRWQIPTISPANRAALSRLCRQVPIDRGIMPVAA